LRKKLPSKKADTKKEILPDPQQIVDDIFGGEKDTQSEWNTLIDDFRERDKDEDVFVWGNRFLEKIFLRLEKTNPGAIKAIREDYKTSLSQVAPDKSFQPAMLNEIQLKNAVLLNAMRELTTLLVKVVPGTQLQEQMMHPPSPSPSEHESEQESSAWETNTEGTFPSRSPSRSPATAAMFGALNLMTDISEGVSPPVSSVEAQQIGPTMKEEDFGTQSLFASVQQFGTPHTEATMFTPQKPIDVPTFIPSIPKALQPPIDEYEKLKGYLEEWSSNDPLRWTDVEKQKTKLRLLKTQDKITTLQKYIFKMFDQLHKTKTAVVPPKKLVIPVDVSEEKAIEIPMISDEELAKIKKTFPTQKKIISKKVMFSKGLDVGPKISSSMMKKLKAEVIGLVSADISPGTLTPAIMSPKSISAATMSPAGFTVATSVKPHIHVPAPDPKQIKYLLSLVPGWQQPALEPMRGEISKKQKLFEEPPHGVRHAIGSAITVMVYPHRFEFQIYPGVTREDMREVASKVFHHMRTLSRDVSVSLFEVVGKKHKQLLSAEKLHKYTLKDYMKMFAHLIRKSMRKPKKIVLHQFNAVGGALFSETMHNPLYRNYFTV